MDERETHNNELNCRGNYSIICENDNEIQKVKEGLLFRNLIPMGLQESFEQRKC